MRCRYLDIVELNPEKSPWTRKVKANNNTLWKQKVRKHQEKVPIASRSDLSGTCISKCEFSPFFSSLFVIPKSRRVFQYQRAHKKETISCQNLTINENSIIIHFQNTRLKAGYVVIYVYKIYKIIYIIVCSEVSEIRTCNVTNLCSNLNSSW